MVADLQHRVGLLGKTRAQIVELLGPSEQEGTDMRLSHYHLCPSFMDIYILELKWKNDQVRAVTVRDT